MKRTKTIAITTAILTLLSASAVFAASTNNSTVSIPKSSQTQSGRVDGGYKSHLDSLLAAGTITQVQEDAIQAALVTAGTITQVQSDAITAALKTAVKGPDGDKAALDALVTAGTITQAQEDAIQGS